MEFRLEPVAPGSVLFTNLKPSDTFIHINAYTQEYPLVYMVLSKDTYVSLDTAEVIDASNPLFKVISVRLDCGEISCGIG